MIRILPQGQHISKQEVVEEQSIGIESLHAQLQGMIGEWSCVIKQAIFQEDMGFNVDTRKRAKQPQ
jgi:hypothetical protein